MVILTGVVFCPVRTTFDEGGQFSIWYAVPVSQALEIRVLATEMRSFGKLSFTQIHLQRTVSER